MRKLKSYLVVAVAALILSASAHAQTALGSVQGRVFDANNNAIVGATVYPVTGPTGTGLQHAVITNSDGRFMLDNLAPGAYALSAFKVADGYGDVANPFYQTDGSQLTQANVTSGTENADISITLGQPGGTLHVVAYDAVTNQPITTLTYSMHQRNNSGAVLIGKQNIPADFLLPPTDVVVRFDALGYATWEYHENNRDYITIRGGDQRSITVQMKPLH
jgi:hypothetical protein